MAFKKLKLWFDIDLAKMLATKIATVHPPFNSKSFIQSMSSKIDQLELKDRVEVFADEINKSLNLPFAESAQVLINILGPENEEETGMFKNYYWVMPIAKYIEKYGIDKFKISMQAIEEVTKRNTGEYTIRPFIEKYEKQTLKQMLKWSKHKNKHVRRLSCEGLRPRLPWASKLDSFISNPLPVLPILNNLKDDSSKYVQKSVANCINDILKDNAEVGQQLINEWNVDELGKERKWLIKHALRNLIKAGDVWAMKVVG